MTENQLIINTIHSALPSANDQLVHNAFISHHAHFTNPTHPSISSLDTKLKNLVYASNSLKQNISPHLKNINEHNTFYSHHPLISNFLGIPSLVATILSNPTLLDAILGNPNILAIIAGSPSLLGAIERNPALLTFLSINLDVLDKGITFAQMASILGTNTPSINALYHPNLIIQKELSIKNHLSQVHKTLENEKAKYKNQILPPHLIGHKLETSKIANAKALASTLQNIAKEIDLRLPAYNQINPNAKSKTTSGSKELTSSMSKTNSLSQNANLNHDVLFANPALLALLSAATMITNKGKLFTPKEHGLEQETQSEAQLAKSRKQEGPKKISKLDPIDKLAAQLLGY